jgi:hypothetical protein
MFTFFHPWPVVDRKEIPVLSVRQDVQVQIAPNTVLLIRRNEADDSPASSPPQPADGVTGDEP